MSTAPQFSKRGLKRKLKRLGGFAPIVETDGFKFAGMRGGEEVQLGVLAMPWSHLSDTAMRFYELCYADGWYCQNSTGQIGGGRTKRQTS